MEQEKKYPQIRPILTLETILDNSQPLLAKELGTKSLDLF